MKSDNAIAEEIIQIRFKKSDTFKSVLNRFYKIMRKHGIKENTPSNHGHIGARFEWTLYWTLFLDQITSTINLGRITGDFETPKDLLK